VDTFTAEWFPFFRLLSIVVMHGVCGGNASDEVAVIMLLM
jgi:hypothetical protein